MSSTDHLAKVGTSVVVGEGKPLTLIAGPCAIESTELVMQVAETVFEICSRLGVQYIFKASFDKANRTSASTFRGPGVTKGLEVLQQVKDKLGLPVLTDIHESHHVAEVASVVDVLQIPAFLCRQTDLLVAAAETGKAINVKKGQFLSPQEMGQVAKKLRSSGAENLMLTERGNSFGYNTLVVDFRSLPQLQRTRCSNRVAKVAPPVANASTFRRLRAPQLPSEWMACSWRFTPTQTKQ
jgi:2-dehydro-3-deoxyphosphooctonate aldolase (KDO 8-P synthase)